MAAPSAPIELSAEAINTTTAELRWSAPTDDGGQSITNYEIFRGIDGATPTSFITIGNLLKFSDTTLSARNNAAYQVKAINAGGTGPASNTASTTTSTSEAQTIKELLFDNWSLTGELAKETTGDMTEPVHFYDRGQVPGNKFPKAITVQKINELGNENITEHPNFLEQSDTFEITCFLQVIDSADDQFSVWIDLIQRMTSEVIRILKTVYSPSSSTGEFFRTTTGWTKDDTFFPDDPELTRRLRFTLTRIFSNDNEVYIGYKGVLVFDTSDSQGDSKPNVDYTFASVTDIKVREGFSQIPILTKDKTKGVGVPQYVRGVFSGTFSALMFAQRTNILGDTIEKLQNIYRLQTSPPIRGQNAEVVLVRLNQNNENLDRVTAITVLTAGTGYTMPPTVSITGGGGSGSTADSVLANIVSSIDVTNEGNDDYTSQPSVTVIGGGGTGATASAVLSGSVSNIEVTNGGTGYTSQPDVELVGGGGVAATASAVIDIPNVIDLIVTNPGSFYTSPPDVVISGGGSSAQGATGEAEILSKVASIDVLSGGDGYTSVPDVIITGGGGTGATADANIDGIVSEINVTAEGSGYTSVPDVALTGGGGNGATALALLSSILTRKSFMKISTIDEDESDEELLKYTIIGTLTRPTIFTDE